MNRWENGDVEGIFYSRFIASWNKQHRNEYSLFREWLESLVINNRYLTEEEVNRILLLYDNGKMELEVNASLFRKSKEH